MAMGIPLMAGDVIPIIEDLFCVQLAALLNFTYFSVTLDDDVDNTEIVSWGKTNTITVVSKCYRGHHVLPFHFQDTFRSSAYMKQMLC